MSSIKKPHNWLCFIAFAAAFWVTFRVMAADPPLRAAIAVPAEGMTGEFVDPALDKMIAHFAVEAGVKKR